ncbi:Uncharacterised protein [Vibrio cholerae]|nr:Uncharacterised protein [Vibrio cholerae]
MNNPELDMFLRVAYTTQKEKGVISRPFECPS